MEVVNQSMLRGIGNIHKIMKPTQLPMQERIILLSPIRMVKQITNQNSRGDIRNMRSGIERTPQNSRKFMQIKTLSSAMMTELLKPTIRMIS